MHLREGRSLRKRSLPRTRREALPKDEEQVLDTLQPPIQRRHPPRKPPQSLVHLPRQGMQSLVHPPPQTLLLDRDPLVHRGEAALHLVLHAFEAVLECLDAGVELGGVFGLGVGRCVGDLAADERVCLLVLSGFDAAVSGVA